MSQKFIYALSQIIRKQLQLLINWDIIENFIRGSLAIALWKCTENIFTICWHFFIKMIKRNKFVKLFNIYCAISNVCGQKNCKLLSKLKATQDLEFVAIENKTTSQKVQMQYQDMPYPAFTMEQMDHERRHYGDNPQNKQALHYMPTDVLSMVNHYLYKVNRK